MKKQIQELLFEQVKLRLPDNLSLGNSLSDVLSLSPDAVYRRFRGETPVTMNEAHKICNHFNLSFDALAEMGEGKVIFNYTPLNTLEFSLEGYLEGILDAFKKLKSLDGAEMILSVNNINFFHMLNFPQLIRFKLYFWAKTHVQIPKYKDEKFAHERTSQRAFELGKEIIQIYNSIPSSEIYDPEFMRGFMRQIHYYKKAHLFEDPEYSMFLYNRINMLSDHLKEQAIHGKKFMYSTQPPANGNSFTMYLNETINPDSTFYFESANNKGVFISHNIMSYLETTNQEYAMDSKSILDRQIANSSQISLINEKERNNFFHEVEQTINHFKKKLEIEKEF